MPNKTKKFKDVDQILFECECYGSHFLQITHDNDDNVVWFQFIDRPSNLFQVLKWWFKQRKLWFSEAILSVDDAKEIIKTLNRFVKKYDK